MRILLVCLDNLGDLAFCSALVPPLRKAFPEASISIWSKEYSSGLLPFIPGLDRTHVCDPFWDRSPGSGRGSVLRFLSTLREVSGQQYDVVLLPNTSRRTALTAWASRIPRRIGFGQRHSTSWLNNVLAPERREQPVLAEWSRLLAPLKVVPGPLTIHLEVPSSLVPARQEMRSRLNSDMVVGIHPFAGDARREAPLQFWREVLAGLRVLGVSQVLVAGRRAEARAFVSHVLHPEGLDLLVADELGGGGLSSVLLATSLCRTFIGNDSGPLHCAAGLGVPVLGLYLPGDWPRAMPQGRGPWRALRCASPREARPQEALAHIRELFKPAD